jgi:hypothetical protein
MKQSSRGSVYKCPSWFRRKPRLPLAVTRPLLDLVEVAMSRNQRHGVSQELPVIGLLALKPQHGLGSFIGFLPFALKSEDARSNIRYTRFCGVR